MLYAAKVQYEIKHEPNQGRYISIDLVDAPDGTKALAKILVLHGGYADIGKVELIELDEDQWLGNIRRALGGGVLFEINCNSE